MTKHHNLDIYLQKFIYFKENSFSNNDLSEQDVLINNYNNIILVNDTGQLSTAYFLPRTGPKTSSYGSYNTNSNQG